MSLGMEAFAATTRFFCEEHLLTVDERDQILWLFGDDFPFSDAVRAADTVHVHVKVEDVATRPHQRIRAMGAVSENAAPGYVKYSFPGGINMIFSSIPVAADDLVEGAVTIAKPFMDHAGLDIRHCGPSYRAVFDTVPARATAMGWRAVTQDGPVHCCHTEVAAKHWVYPPACLASWRRPLEVAFGALRIVDKTMGCDLRPLDPAHPLAGSSTGCGAGGAAPG
ncbi:hypothetical protein [[Mycobacterium] nativiensis]|uniref:Uncharacterized protein n=1 Tax=[Mycobacterium] nativiensis TaxID=2855503 RepID=A0ABU5Y060_9MYCO|nr:hypothetical protein [Mycolicibacter sp. MYC340]MEB3033387.1 hypothetical protein [Mycolicibacter sp. MYC340]